MRVVAHPDPVVLEAELLRRLDGACPRGSVGATLVLVPASRLRDHVQRRMTAARGAWLGVDVLNFRSAALRALTTARPRPVRSLSSGLRREILRRELSAVPDNEWSMFVRRRPRALGRIAGALNDLREAGVGPGALERHAGDEPGMRAMAEAYRRYERTLAHLAERGWYDDAGLVHTTLPHVAKWARRYRTVFLHGAYELVGTYLDLVREIDGCAPLTALLPVRSGAPVSRFAEAYAREFLVEKGEIDDLGPCSAGRPVVEHLYDQTSETEPAADFFAFRHVQGVEAEVHEAVRGAVADLRDGVPPSEVAIVARTLEPYAPAIERAFTAIALPWTSSLEGPIRRQPFVRDFLVLLEIVDLDFPRARTAEILRSPRIRWPESDRPPGEAADAWSRRARLLGGRDEWTAHLPRWVESAGPGRHRRDDADEGERAASVRKNAGRIARAVEQLASEIPSAPDTWSGHARALRTLLDARVLVPDDDRAAVALRALLDEMALLDTLLDDHSPIAFRDMRSWLELAVDACGLPSIDGDHGGVRVLGVMQARGLTFRRVHLLGMNEGAFPRAPREDPVLPDRVRSKLRHATGRPLPIKALAADEERLLLSTTIGGAEERVFVSWQRAEESGKSRTPSLALREIARLATGRPAFDRVLEDPGHHVPSHPEQALCHAVRRDGLLSPSEERVLAALLEPDPARLDERFPELRSGLRMLAATQTFDGPAGEFDGRVGPLGRPPALAVGSIERLGSCPLQFFFRHLLRVRELDDEASAQRMDQGELGRHVHEILRRVYRALDEEGRFAADDTVRLTERGVELLDRELGRLFGDAGERLHRRLPVLWKETERSWREALAAFLRTDLPRVAREKWEIAGLEETVEGTLALGGEVQIELRGRYDRRLERDGATVVCDYKTGSNPQDHVNPTPMLKGQRLQVPLYALLSGGEVEILPVGPRHAGDDAIHSFRLDGQTDAVRNSLRDTLRTVVGLYEAGCFPHNETSKCRWCVYVNACRKGQPPTEERETHSPDAAAHRALPDKSTRKPLAPEDVR